MHNVKKSADSPDDQAAHNMRCQYIFSYCGGGGGGVPDGGGGIFAGWLEGRSVTSFEN
jgi:hypothetical protein